MKIEKISEEIRGTLYINLYLLNLNDVIDSGLWNYLEENFSNSTIAKTNDYFYIRKILKKH